MIAIEWSKPRLMIFASFSLNVIFRTPSSPCTGKSWNLSSSSGETYIRMQPLFCLRQWRRPTKIRSDWVPYKMQVISHSQGRKFFLSFFIVMSPPLSSEAAITCFSVFSSVRMHIPFKGGPRENSSCREPSLMLHLYSIPSLLQVYKKPLNLENSKWVIRLVCPFNAKNEGQCML